MVCTLLEEEEEEEEELLLFLLIFMLIIYSFLVNLSPTSISFDHPVCLLLFSVVVDVTASQQPVC